MPSRRSLTLRTQTVRSVNRDHNGGLAPERGPAPGIAALRAHDSAVETAGAGVVNIQIAHAIVRE